MPEMTFTVKWPDGAIQECYSPSLVMHDHLSEGATYSVIDFTARSVEALAIASERVRAKFGYFCSSAADSASRITTAAAAYSPGDTVEVLAMFPSLSSQES